MRDLPVLLLETLAHLVSSNTPQFKLKAQKDRYFTRADFTYLIGMDCKSQVYFVFYPLGFYKRDFQICFHLVYTGAGEVL